MNLHNFIPTFRYSLMVKIRGGRTLIFVQITSYELQIHSEIVTFSHLSQFIRQ